VGEQDEKRAVIREQWPASFGNRARRQCGISIPEVGRHPSAFFRDLRSPKIKSLQMSDRYLSLLVTVWDFSCNGNGMGRVPHDPHRPLNGEEGAHLKDGMGRSHLPLRGKLGWMTP
jgi:hypothetical protein